jgi:hypothetical protein
MYDLAAKQDHTIPVIIQGSFPDYKGSHSAGTQVRGEEKIERMGFGCTPPTTAEPAFHWKNVILQDHMANKIWFVWKKSDWFRVDLAVRPRFDLLQAIVWFCHTLLRCWARQLRTRW